MSHVSKMSGIDKFWTFFLVLLVISIPTSKAGMNAASLILGIATLFYLPLRLNSCSGMLKTTFIVCCSCFFIGVIGPIFVNYNTQDIQTFTQKNVYLLVIPIAAYLMSRTPDIKLYAYAFIAASVVSAMFSLTKLNSQEWISASRVTGFLDFSRHNNSLLLAMAFCFAFIKPSKIKSYMWLVPVLVFIGSIIISGTRGGWLAMGALLVAAIALYHRYLIVPSILMVALGLLSISYLNPNYMNTLQHRVTSIVDTKNDPSNNERLTTWFSGIEYLSHNASDNKAHFLFGSGMISTNQIYRDYMGTLPPEKLKTFTGVNGIGGGTDFHNGAIDVLAKSGVIFFVLICGVFLRFLGSCIMNWDQNSFSTRAFLLYSVGFLVALPFYSLLQDYSVLTLSFIIPLVLSERISKETINES